MEKIILIHINNKEWTEIQGFSSKGLRVKSWYERVTDREVFLYKEPKIYTYGEQKLITKEIWTELIACKIGNFIGLNIPEAIPAELDGNYGILIKNFLKRGAAGMPVNELVEAKEILGVLTPSCPHNIASIELLCNSRLLHNKFWEEYIKMLIFDCIIGNNDRHDENWGLLFDRNSTSVKLAPIYDNASCLTSGETEERVCLLLKDETALERYVNKSRPPNLFINDKDKTHYKHFEIITYLLKKAPFVAEIVKELTKKDYVSYAHDIINSIQQMDVPENYRIADNRKELIIKILDLRKRKLKEIIDVHV